jgi:hypothetical protein
MHAPMLSCTEYSMGLVARRPAVKTSVSGPVGLTVGTPGASKSWATLRQGAVYFLAVRQPLGAFMIKENWRAIVLSLLAVNLVFMALLEMQRRVIWQDERDYFAQIKQTIESTDKAKASYDYITRQLAEITARVNNVEIAVQEVPAHVKETRDIQARVNSLQTAVEHLAAAKP